MTTKFEVGDIVRLHPAEAEVVYDNGDGRLDLKYLDSDRQVEYIPADKVTFVRKRPVAEPAVGAAIKYLSAYGNVHYDYIRTPSGWATLKSGVVGKSFCKWTDFDHSRVRLYQAATTPPK